MANGGDPITPSTAATWSKTQVLFTASCTLVAGIVIEALEGALVHVRARVARGHARARWAGEALFGETRGGDGGLNGVPGRIPAQWGLCAVTEARSERSVPVGVTRGESSLSTRATRSRTARGPAPVSTGPRG